MTFAFEMSQAFRIEHPAIIRPVALGYFTPVPSQYRPFIDSRGCVVIRVPQYPAGLYCH